MADDRAEVNETFERAYSAITALNVTMVGVCGALLFELPNLGGFSPQLKTTLTVWFAADGILALVVQYIHTLAARNWANANFFIRLAEEDTRKGSVFNLPAAEAKKHHDNANNAYEKASRGIARQQTYINVFKSLSDFGFISFVIGLLVFAGYWIAAIG